MGYEKGKQGVTGLDMSVAPWEWNFWILRLFANPESKCHLQAVQGMDLIFLGGSRFGRFDF